MRRMFPVVLVAVMAVSGAKGLVAAQSIPRGAAAAAAGTAPVQQSAGERSQTLNKLFAEIWEDRLKHNPEFASSLGDKRYDDQLSDYSVKAMNAELERGLGYIQRLGEIDTEGLPEQEKLSTVLLLRSLVDEQEGAKFKEWEMPLNQFYGVHTELAQLPVHLSFDAAKDYDNYIARLRQVPRVFSQIQTDLEMGIEDGRIPPAYLLEKVEAQTAALAGQKAAESAFALPLKRFPATVSAAEQKRISTEMLDAISTSVLPAYQHFEKFLQVQYVPKGRKDPGAWSLPDGDAYYAFRVRQSTTLNNTPAEIHQIGLNEVKRDEAEMLTIAKKLGFEDLKSFNAALKADPKDHPTSKEQLLDRYRGFESQMEPKLPQLFGRLPKAKLEVIAMPSFIEKDQAAAFYDVGTADGKRPGRVDINTYNATGRSLAAVEAVAYHEGIPGHHLQLSIAEELTGLPEFRKYEGYTAFVEGWGLYSERLGKEVGFYQDPYSDYGRLEADIWRAIRLVVDTGVHSQHWTRQQMVDYFHEHSAIDETNVQAEVDRYIAWPGQALGYKMGQLTILGLRTKAQKELGSAFSLTAFHDEVLDSGALPMDVLAERVNVWIATQKAAGVGARSAR